MSLCRFDFALSGPAGSVLGEIRSQVAQAGGSFVGSNEAGTFSIPTPVGIFRGTYEVIGVSLVIDVSEKPFFVPCGAIETKLAELVRGTE